MKTLEFEKRLEKALHEIEELKKSEKQMQKQMEYFDEAFKTFKIVISKTEREKHKMKEEKNILEKKYDELLESLPKEVPGGEVIKEAVEKVKENFDLVKEFTKEEVINVAEALEPKMHISSVNDFVKVLKNKDDITAFEAAKKLGVHEIQINNWVDSLKDSGMVRLNEDKISLTVKGKKK